MAEDLTALKIEARRVTNQYFDSLNSFYKEHIPFAVDVSTTNVTDARLNQIESDLAKLTSKLNSSPSLGLFLLDLALTFIPIVAAQVVERALKTSFQSMQQMQRHWEMVKIETLRKVVLENKKRTKEIGINTPDRLLEVAASERLYAQLKVNYFSFWKFKSQVKEDLNKAEQLFKKNIETPPSNPFFDYTTAVVKDEVKEVGKKLLTLTKRSSLQSFDKQETPKRGREYNQLAVSRFRNSPNALAKFFLNDICTRQIEINNDLRLMALNEIDMISISPHLKHNITHYNFLYYNLPSGNELQFFKLTLSETIEAAIWLMYLGDPKKWFASKNPSTGEHYRVDRTAGYLQYNPGYFFLGSTLPQEIQKHLLETFHPFIGETAENFAEYYKRKKQEALGTDPGINTYQGYRYTPTQPDKSVEDVTSRSYTANDTALANLQIFFTNLYDSMNASEPYFEAILQRHSIL